MSRTVIAAPSTFAAGAGAQIAEMGGSVFDSVIAATLTAMCSEPGVCAPGGGGFLTIWPEDEDPVSIDGHMAMPGIGAGNGEPSSTRVEMDYGGGTVTDVGPGTVAVPGAFAAFAETHSRWGRMPWQELIQHVASTLEGGFPLSPSSHHYLQFSGEPIFGLDPGSRQALFDGNRLRCEGELVHVEPLVASLKAIAADGADTFYRGDLAATIVADLERRGGLLTRQDLSQYRAIAAPPARVIVDNWTVATTPPPAVGGVVLATLLHHQVRSSDPLDPQTWLRAQQKAFGLRLNELEPSHDRGASGRRALGQLTRSGSTVSIAGADDNGNVCAATMSGGYGSGVIPQGTGLWMNNSLGELELIRATGTPNPGERLMSNMAPTVASDGHRRVALGSPGADRITSALATTVTCLIAGMELKDAIEHPRLHLDLASNTVSIEPGLKVDPGSFEVRRFDRTAMFFGGVTAAGKDENTLVGHADSRRTGGVAFAEWSKSSQ